LPSTGAEAIKAFRKVTMIRPLRLVSPSFALFCVATALVFHLDLADKAERTLFIKDLAIAGALMVIAAGAAQIRGVVPVG
jgi:hypothetical protein